ncbi:hypothetical protein FHG87_006663, partial [Trinorchestia longiramus]
YLYHALVYQRVSGAPPLTAISMLTKRNSTDTIESMLATLIVNYRKVVGKALAPKCVVTDHSFTNLNAILAAFQLGDLTTYLDRVWALPEEEDHFSLIKLCKAHFMKNIAVNAKVKFPKLKPKQRRLIMAYFAAMTEAQGKNELYATFRDFAQLIQSPSIEE